MRAFELVNESIWPLACKEEGGTVGIDVRAGSRSHGSCPRLDYPSRVPVESLVTAD